MVVASFVYYWNVYLITISEVKHQQVMPFVKEITCQMTFQNQKFFF